MKIIESLARRLGYERRRPARRSIDAGAVSRLTASWSGSMGSIDREIYGKLETVRGRSRDLSYNNDYMRKFLALVRTNVVGPTGFALQVRATFPDGTPDKAGNDAVEMAFYRWARRGVCEMSRKHSFVGVCDQVIGAVARDGEALVRKVFGGNEFNFALQVLDIDRLATLKNEDLGDGRVIKMGVELSRVGEPIAYHLYRHHPGDRPLYAFHGSEIERVPASEIYHVGAFERPEQTRCLPWAVSAILRLQNLGAYEEAAVIAARFGAAKMAYWSPGEGDAESFSDSKDEKTGEFFVDFEPGTVGIAPPGAELKSVNWDYPHAQYDPFTKACLRGIASGLGVAYASLSSDLQGVNYSSIRSGVVDERDQWMRLQRWLAETFLDPLYADWLRMALLAGQVKTPAGGTITADKFDKFNVPDWRGRRWQWVDPLKDLEANVLAIENGLTSRRAVAADRGEDLEEVWANLAAEKAAAAKLGITLGSPPKPKGKESEEEAAQAGAANG